MTKKLNMLWVDGNTENIPEKIDALRKKLSPQGDIVSPKGREITIKTFGEPLTPQEVVKRICGDISSKGLEALLDYSRKIDRADLSAGTIRVPLSEIEEAHRRADPDYLASIRRIRDMRRPGRAPRTRCLLPGSRLRSIRARSRVDTGPNPIPQRRSGRI